MSRINPPPEIPKASAEAQALFQKELMDKVPSDVQALLLCCTHRTGPWASTSNQILRVQVKRKLDKGHAKTEFSDRLEAAAMAAVSAAAHTGPSAGISCTRCHDILQQAARVAQPNVN